MEVKSGSLKYVVYCLSLWNIHKSLAIFYKHNRLEKGDTENYSKPVGHGLPIVTSKIFYVGLQLHIL